MGRLEDFVNATSDETLARSARAFERERRVAPWVAALMAVKQRDDVALLAGLLAAAPLPTADDWKLIGRRIARRKRGEREKPVNLEPRLYLAHLDYCDHRDALRVGLEAATGRRERAEVERKLFDLVETVARSWRAADKRITAGRLNGAIHKRRPYGRWLKKHGLARPS